MRSGLVLLTGASGFVGSAVLVELLRAGRPVRTSVRVRREDLPASAESVETGEISGDTDWRSAVTGVDVVIHAAARAHILRETPDPLPAYRRVNRDATLRLARQAAEAGVRRFVFLSSIGVNGNETRGRPFRPDDRPDPHSPYALAKHEAEMGLRSIGAETGMEIVILRPPLVIATSAKGNIGVLVKAVKWGMPLPFGALTSNRRAFVSLSTLVDLIVTVLDHPKAAGEILLASDGAPFSTRQLVEHIGEQAGRRPLLVPVPAKLLGVLLRLGGKQAMASQLLGDLEVDISRTRSLLDWDPAHRHGV